MAFPRWRGRGGESARGGRRPLAREALKRPFRCSRSSAARVVGRVLLFAGAARARGFAANLVFSSGGFVESVSVAAPSAPHVQGATSTLSVLQWNAHGQCFLPCLPGQQEDRCDTRFPICRDGARRFLADTLQNASLDLDFAALEGFNLDMVTDGGGGALRERWANLTHVCGGEAGYGVFPFDSATLVYDKTRWEPAGQGDSLQRVGCFEHADYSEVRGNETNYRAFLVQAMRRRGSSEVVVAAVSHYPHTERYGGEIGALRVAVQEVVEKALARKVIVMADTNNDKPSRLPWPSGRSSQALMDDIYPDAGEVASTELLTTCCAWRYLFAYDRAIAAGFPGASMETVLPFGEHGHPPFAAIDMHDPIVGRLTYSSQGDIEMLPPNVEATAAPSARSRAATGWRGGGRRTPGGAASVVAAALASTLAAASRGC